MMHNICCCCFVPFVMGVKLLPNSFSQPFNSLSLCRLLFQQEIDMDTKWTRKESIKHISVWSRRNKRRKMNPKPHTDYCNQPTKKKFGFPRSRMGRLYYKQLLRYFHLLLCFSGLFWIGGLYRVFSGILEGARKNNSWRPKKEFDLEEEEQQQQQHWLKLRYSWPKPKRFL